MISPSNCSTGFSSWNTRSFTKISTTTTSAWTQYRVSVSSQILSAIEHVLFELLRRINLCNRSSVFNILASSNKQPLITDKERTTNTKMKLQSGSKTRLIDRQGSKKSSRAKNSHDRVANVKLNNYASWIRTQKVSSRNQFQGKIPTKLQNR